VTKADDPPLAPAPARVRAGHAPGYAARPIAPAPSGGAGGHEGAPAKFAATPDQLDSRERARAVAAESGLPFVEPAGLDVPAAALAALPRAVVVKHLVCPVGWDRDRLRVALADPLDLELLESLEHLAGRPVQACVATVDEIRRAIARHYDLEEGEMKALLAGLETAGGDPHARTAAGPSVTDARTEGGAGEADAPVIRLVETIIAEAVRLRASDIHLEPLERRFRVRCRVDGSLLELDAPPLRLHRPVISRIKIMARLSIAEKRLPQDGRMQIVRDGRSLDLRVSTLPTAHGESAVLRILDREGLRPGLAELGFEGDDERAFRQLIAAPDGMVLLTGPTGSGKTTTLYGCLHQLNQSDRKIITVEDPVEYQLDGINQVPVRPAVGMTFAAALRAMLRQAPNIIMVGEIRDRETADMALNAALTGHLVFSTLHTNDAPGAVTRLTDLGARPFLVAAALRATLAQRLVRRICPRCRQPQTLAEQAWRRAGFPPDLLAGAQLFRGAGCPACHGTGYLGRLGLFEIFLINDEIRGLIGQNTSAARLRAQARRDGMRSLREDGMRKVLAGLTTIDEVVAATSGGAE